MRIFGISSAALLIALIALSALGALQFEAQAPARLTVRPAAAAPLPAAPQRLDAPPTHVRALTYNVFLRPPPVNWADRNECRARALGRALAAESTPHDVLVFNESFEHDAVAALANSLRERFPHQVLSQPAASGLRVNGGVSLLSPHPIEQWRAVPFDDCIGKWNDCLANKGFVWALLDLGDNLKLNVLATHLNSGGGYKARRVRRKQLAQIRDFMHAQPSTARWPTLLLGDLNINGLRYEARYPDSDALTEYARAMALLGNTCQACKDESCRATCNPHPTDTFRARHGPWTFDAPGTRAANTYLCLYETLQPCASPDDADAWRTRQRIDYILDFGPAPDAGDRALALELEQVHTLDFATDTCDTNFLSDHRAVEAHFAVRKATRADTRARATRESQLERARDPQP